MLEEVAPVTGEVVLLLMKEVLPVPVKNLEVFGGGKVPNAVVASKRGAALTPATRNEIAISSSAVLPIGAVVVAAVRLLRERTSHRPLVGDGVGADATAAAASSSAASAGGIGRGLLMGSGWLVGLSCCHDVLESKALRMDNDH